MKPIVIKPKSYSISYKITKTDETLILTVYQDKKIIDKFQFMHSDFIAKIIKNGGTRK